MLRITLKQLQYFVAAAESDSLSEASHQVHIAQPAVASAIKKLENQLNVDLIIRHHAQGISLTAAGRKLLVEARNLLRHADVFQEKATSLSEHLSGEIILACFQPLAPILLPTLLSGFSNKHPKINFSVTEGTQDEVIDALRSGIVEVALMYDFSIPEDIVLSQIYSSNLDALLPEDHPLTSQKTVSLAELAQEPFIVFNSPMLTIYYKKLFEQQGLKLKIRHTASSVEVLRGMVGTGLGVSMLPTQPRTATTYDGHRILARQISDKLSPLTVNIARMHNLRLTHNAEGFVDYCTSQKVKSSFV